MICRIYDVPGATREQYDQVNEKLPELPEGGRVHIAGSTTDGLRVIEVWDSKEQIDRFMEEGGLGEAMAEAQIPEPTITEFEVFNLEVTQ